MRGSKPIVAAAIAPFVLVALVLGAWLTLWQTSTAEHTCTVESKDRTVQITVTDGSGQSRSDMRVYTDCGVFAVSDDLLRLNFTSADTYSAMREGEQLTFTSVGWRAPFLSIFPNIVEVAR
jgi:hypothetical protein